VRAHDGKIELESRLGRGTTFRIWLPFHERKPRLLEDKAAGKEAVNERELKSESSL
jgi:hypothetical protein